MSQKLAASIEYFPTSKNLIMAVPPTSDTPSATASTLTFPPQHYAKLSPAPFLHANLSSNPSTPLRPNGRSPVQSRPATINTSSLTNASGSAVIRLGSTSVVCAVRAELLPIANIHAGLPAELESWNGPEATQSDLPNARPDAEIVAELSLLVPNLELSTGCNPSHLPGNAPSTEAQSLTQRVLTLLRISDLVPLRELLVWHEHEIADETTDEPDADADTDAERPRFELKAIWTLYIDILYISLDGSAFSSAWLSLLAALQDTRLPLARWDMDREMILCSANRDEAAKLALRALPCPLSAAVFRYEEDGRAGMWVLHDPDDFEESVASGEITVVVAHGKMGKAREKGASKDVVLRIEAGGRVPGVEEVRVLVAKASERLDEWSELLQWDRKA